MKTVCNENACTGCNACINICPKNAIKLNDDLRFLNSIIDESKCINCNLCKKICQMNNPVDLVKPIQWNQGWIQDNIIRDSSSSGGLASALMISFIKSGGCVCSCVFKNGEFIFEIENNYENIKKFSGSKYVKSDLKMIYKKILEKIKDKEKVLFIGLPCQVAGIKKFIPKSLQSYLYTIDLICHGTPSVKVLKKFLEQQDIRLSDVNDIKFRKNNSFFLSCDGKCFPKEDVLDAYTISFLNTLTYTENCYRCQYAQLARVSDITLGDSWGNDLSRDEQKKGVSLILCQTEKGKELLSMCDLELKEVDLNKAINNNHQLSHPSIAPKSRIFFLTKLNEGHDFNKMIKKIYPKTCLKQFVKKLVLTLGLYKK